MKLLKTDLFTRVFFTLLLFTLSPMLTVFLLISAIQSVAKHTQGNLVESLTVISKTLLKYLTDIIEYVTYARNTPQYPLTPWRP